MRLALGMVVLAACIPTIGETGSAQDKPADVSLKVVTYSELGKAVKDLKGKVVIVDFWQDSCLNCKINFPHLVEQYHKYAGDVAAISVCLDEPGQEGVKDRALNFLKSKKAVFPNFILDEKPEVWQEKLGTQSLPLLFVFDKEGKAYKLPGETLDKDLKNVDKLVEDLIRKK
jgi:thiol-disulfide isomerase/thioredoxin